MVKILLIIFIEEMIIGICVTEGYHNLSMQFL